MEAIDTIRSDIYSNSERAEPFIHVQVFSLVGLAVSLLAARYGLEIDPTIL